MTEIHIFCDGCTIDNGREDASGGIGIWSDHDNMDVNVSEKCHFQDDEGLAIPSTNQKCELYAVLRTLQLIKNDLQKGYTNNSDVRDSETGRHSYSENCRYVIFTDSEYSIKCVTEWIKKWKLNGWKTYNKKPVKNRELIVGIDKLLSLIGDRITFKHIRAHTIDNISVYSVIDKNELHLQIGNRNADILSRRGAFL